MITIYDRDGNSVEFSIEELRALKEFLKERQEELDNEKED